MRTLGFRTHALLAAAAAVGVVAALAEPWYGKAPRAQPAGSAGVGSLEGPVEGLATGVQRWMTAAGGTSGWDVLGVWAQILAGCAVLTALGAIGCLVPAIQGIAREALRYGGLGAFSIAVWKLIDTPGPNAAMEPRVGAFIAVAAGLVAVSSGAGVASAPLRRRTAHAYA